MKTFAPLLVALAFAGAAFAAPIHQKQPAPHHISEGQAVALTDYLVPGKTVIFDFTSKFCPPCRAYEEPLKALHAKRADLVVVKVDINRPDVKGIDWQSPVAQQFDLHSIPHFKVYGPTGKLLAEDKVVFSADGRPNYEASSNAARRMVDGWINGSN